MGWNKFVKASAAALAVSVTMTALLAGCGDAGSKSTPEATAAQTAAPKAEKIKVILPYSADLEKIPGGKDVNTNDMADQIRKLSGMDVTFETLPKDDADQKISMLLASGDAGDLLTISNKSLFFRYAPQGVFTQTDDLLSKMPDYSKNVAESTRNIAKVDGKSLGFVYPATVEYDRGLSVRQDIFDKYGIKTPTTLDEFYTCLKELKEKAKVIPFSIDKLDMASSGLSKLEPIAGAFGVAVPTVVKDNKLVFSYTQPEFKEFLGFVKKMYDEGLLDKEFSVNKVNAARDKMTAGTVAVGTMAWWDQKVIQDAMDQKGEGGKVKYIPMIKGSNGKGGLSQTLVVSSLNVIPTTSKNKEAAAKFYNFLCGDKYGEFQKYGVEGLTYTKNGSEYKPDVAKYNEVYPYSSLFSQLYTAKSTYEYRLIAKGFVPYYNPVKETAIRVINYDYYMPSIEDYNKVQKTLRDYVNDNLHKFVLGSRPMSEFDQFVTEFNAKGGKTAQEAIDKWYQTDGKSIKLSN